MTLRFWNPDLGLKLTMLKSFFLIEKLTPCPGAWAPHSKVFAASNTQPRCVALLRGAFLQGAVAFPYLPESICHSNIDQCRGLISEREMLYPSKPFDLTNQSNKFLVLDPELPSSLPSVSSICGLSLVWISFLLHRHLRGGISSQLRTRRN